MSLLFTLSTFATVYDIQCYRNGIQSGIVGLHGIPDGDTASALIEDPIEGQVSVFASFQQTAWWDWGSAKHILNITFKKGEDEVDFMEADLEYHHRGDGTYSPFKIDGDNASKTETGDDGAHYSCSSIVIAEEE